MQDWIIEADIYRIMRALDEATDRLQSERLRQLLEIKRAQLGRLKATGPLPWLPSAVGWGGSGAARQPRTS